MAEVIPFPTGLVAAANYAARTATGTQRPIHDGAGGNVILLPQCRSVARLEEQLERLKERLAAEIGATGWNHPAPFPTARRPLTIEGRAAGWPGNHWTAS
jgi:hypothetical protein